MHVSKTDLQQSSLIDTSNLRESLCFPAGLSIHSALGLQKGAILMLTSNCVSVPSPDRSSHSAACTVGINRLAHLFFFLFGKLFYATRGCFFWLKTHLKCFSFNSSENSAVFGKFKTKTYFFLHFLSLCLLRCHVVAYKN